MNRILTSLALSACLAGTALGDNKHKSKPLEKPTKAAAQEELTTTPKSAKAAAPKKVGKEGSKPSHTKKTGKPALDKKALAKLKADNNAAEKKARHAAALKKKTAAKDKAEKVAAEKKAREAAAAEKKAASKIKPIEKDSLHALRKEIENLKREVAALKAALGKTPHLDKSKKPKNK